MVRSKFTETSNALTSIPAGGRCECEAVVERLPVATVESRLMLAELTERTEAAYTANRRVPTREWVVAV